MKSTARKMTTLVLTCFMAILIGCSTDDDMTQQQTSNTDPDNLPNTIYTMPGEEEMHEGTWLQWPHNYTYGPGQSEKHDASWVLMTKALHTGENVHIVVYNASEKNRVENLLVSNGVNMAKVDFYIWQTDDYWVRDNGPIFVYDEDNNLVVQNWGFNGWGNKAPFSKCNDIPNKVGNALGMEVVSIDMINEGGSIELDGNGTLMAKRSSILNSNRNPGMTQTDAEAYFRTYLGVENFVWLDGVRGQDITDDHIDGTARFAHGNTIVTHAPFDSDPEEYNILQNAKNANGEAYRIVHLPLTRFPHPEANEYGIYINYYVGNEVVLVPNFDDPNDAEANSILQELYPNRTVVGIPAIEMGLEGGGVHCVTQQQPLGN